MGQNILQKKHSYFHALPLSQDFHDNEIFILATDISMLLQDVLEISIVFF